MSTDSGTLPQKAIAGYSDSNSGRFKTMVATPLVGRSILFSPSTYDGIGVDESLSWKVK